MSRKCDICGKGTVTGNTISHSHRKTRRVWQPNLKKVRVMDGTSKKSMTVCTRCIRSNKIVKAI